jgi:hypothetical protein
MKQVMVYSLIIASLYSTSSLAEQTIVTPCDEGTYCLPIVQGSEGDNHLKEILYKYACMAQFGTRFVKYEGFAAHPACRIKID